MKLVLSLPGFGCRPRVPLKHQHFELLVNAYVKNLLLQSASKLICFMAIKWSRFGLYILLKGYNFIKIKSVGSRNASHILNN